MGSFVIIPILIIVIRSLAAASNNSGGGAGSQVQGTRVYSSTGRSILWFLAAVGWGLITITVVISLVSASSTPFDVMHWLVAIVMTGAGLFFAWPILRWVARLGKPKLVYWLAHLCLIFPRTGETYAGAALLAAIALAHRGNATKEERDWIASRIARQERPLGTYAAAVALHQALEARAARDAGDIEAANACSERARALFGTLTYMSKRGIPSGVLAFVQGFLALNEARLGLWGAIDAKVRDDLGPAGVALRGWVDERFRETEASPRTERARKRAANPVVDELFARSFEEKGMSLAEAHLEASTHYRTLMRGEPVSLGGIMMMLQVFDALLHPMCPETLIPESMRLDEEGMAYVHDQVAGALVPVLKRGFVPIYALQNYGPISARVHQGLEQALLDDLARACREVDERAARHVRLSSFDEWCAAAKVRVAFRRLEFSLGTEAARQVWQPYVGSACRLGVLLAEDYPRMRPLAHAVFASLHGDAERFEDSANKEQQAHNMKVTSGVE